MIMRCFCYRTTPTTGGRPFHLLLSEDFLREFHEKYTPAVYKREKRWEFITLEQGNMTVAEYAQKFTQLSVYALNLVSTEEEKCQKFEEGLSYDIRSKLTLTDLENFSKLMAAAIRAEKLVKERRAYFASQKESGNRSGKRKEHPGSTSRDKGTYSGNKKGRNSSTSQSGQRSSSGQIPLCPSYNRYHPGERWRTTGAYLACGQMGHMVKDCPKRQNFSGARSEPTV